MTPEDRSRLETLCKSIQDEHDPKGFSNLIEELSKLLEATQKPRFTNSNGQSGVAKE